VWFKQMKYEVGTLIIGTSADKKTTAFALITEALLETEQYRISIQRIYKDGRIEWDSTHLDERQIVAWEKEHGYTFVK